ncbi:MAG: TPM domain-containing protein [Clostridia bacterium]|nr:TPM domain-containing protein [Clostridia bacterium]
MRRIRISVVLLVFLLAAVLSATFLVSHAETFEQFHDLNAPRIVDNANILSESYKQSLAQEIKRIQDELETDFVVLTTNTLDGQTTRYYAADFYDYNGYGIGNKFSGVIFIIYIDPEGLNNEANYVFTGSEISRFDGRFEALDDAIVSPLRAHDYDAAVQAFLDKFDYYHRWYSRIRLFPILVGVLIGVIAGFIRLSSLKKKMKTVSPAVSAKNYLQDGSYDLRNMNEVFVRSVVTKTPRQSDRSSGGGGGGHFSGSSGVSHSGGGGVRF